MNPPFARSLLLVGALVLLGASATAASAAHVKSSAPIAREHGTRLVMPLMNPERGKKLFVSKGCIACHAINGIGGHDAPAMDAHQMNSLMNPFDFAAKMWNHAPAMIAAQEGALGGQITYTGDELADMIAFIHDDETQHEFSEKDLTATARKMMKHDHGGAPAEMHHAKEIGHPRKAAPRGQHTHAPGAPAHKD